MDQIKIGKFIAKCRKEIGLTQAELAERLNITDRAVSKWETGKSMPDSSIMLELCEILKINVNELLSGEVIEMKNYNEKAEETIIALQKEKESADRDMLKIESVIGYMASITFIVLIFVASFIEMHPIIRVLLIAFGSVVFAIGVAYALKIEQKAGYYECAKCNYKYVPTYKSVFFAMHKGRTRYMKCPKCGKMSWSKKIIG